MPYSPLATPSATREVLESFGLYTKYALGQNFLVNDDVIGKIVTISDVKDTDVILEVGPGIGTLTCALLPRAAAVCAIEMDHDLPRVLAETTANDSEKFALISGDALRTTAEQVTDALAHLVSAGNLKLEHSFPNKFISNLPYAVAATVLLKYFQEFKSIEEATVMVQAEVADRIAAQPGNKIYGAYTIKLRLYAEVQDRFSVAPGNFFPPPRVESAVVNLKRAERKDPDTGESLSQERIAQICHVVEAAFTQRRKTIRNSMSANEAFTKATLDEAFEACGIAPTVRAERLEVDDFIRLTKAIDIIENKSAQPQEEKAAVLAENAPVVPQLSEFYRASNEDDDGYDPYSDRSAVKWNNEPYQEDPWK